MKSQLSGKKIILLTTIMLLATSVLHAVSADFFGTNTQAGENNLRSQISSSNPSAEFFEYQFLGEETPNSVRVVGTDGTPIYVKISRGNNVNDYSYPVGHDDGITYFMEGWSVSVPTSDSGWDEAVAEGVKFEFFEDAGMQTPTTINAFGTFTYHWGTCCTAQDNPTPTGTSEGSAIYAMFTTANGTNSINQIGTIPSRISADVHFLAEIDDSDFFTSVTLIPNGNGEYFAMGGYLLFSQVDIGSIPAGSGWTPTIAPSIAFNPIDESTGVGGGSNITLTFSESIRNTDDSELTDSNVDALIDLRSSNSSGDAITFDATINSTKTVITINPASDFLSEQVVYVRIGATVGEPNNWCIVGEDPIGMVCHNDGLENEMYCFNDSNDDFICGTSSVEDSHDNAVAPSSATFTCAAGGVPTAFFNPTDGSTDISKSSDITITFDEAVRNIDNSDMTDSNVDALITLKKTNSSGASIAFDATINGAYTVITINPTNDFTPNQVVYVEIASVEDVINNATTASNATFTTSANTPPTVTGIPDQTVNEGDSFDTISLDNYVSDTATNDASISWVATGQSTLTVTITNRVATIGSSANWYGSEEITFTATDNDGINPMSGSDVATFTANQVNDAPVFSSSAITAATEDAAYSYTATGSDVDESDVLTFAATTKPDWLTLNTETGVLSGTPENSHVGNHSIILTVSDGEGETAQQSFTISVANTNDAPVFSTPTNTLDEDVAFSSTIIATDVDVGDVLTFAAITLPSWLTFNVTTQLLSGTPDNSHVGGHTVTLIVSDGTESATLTFTINVININDPPVLDTPKTAAIGNVGATVPYSHTFTATDDDVGDNTFTFTVNLGDAAAFLTFDGTATISGSPTDSHARSEGYTITVTMSDGNVEVTTSFIINVLVGETNTAPTFTSTATTAAAEDGVYSYLVSTNDDDITKGWEVLTQKVKTKPAWLNFNIDDTGVGVLSGTPTNDEVGDHPVVLSVIDAFGAEVTQSFTITVTNTNDAPEFTCIDITEATEDSVYSYTVTASDVDVGSAFTFNATTLPSWLTFDGTATISGTPTNDNVGANSVVLTVSDGTATVERPFTITVENINDLPSQFDLISPQNNLTIYDNDIEFQWQLSEDVDVDDILNYIFYIYGTNSFFSDSISNANTYSITARELIDLASPSDFIFSAGDLKLELGWYVAAYDNFITTYSDSLTFKLSISNVVLNIDNIVSLPNEYNLLSPYPNPFNPVTVIKYVAPEAGQIVISVFDIRGREIAKLYNGIQMPGTHTLTWDASEHSNGIYFVMMMARQLNNKQAGTYINTQKLMLIK